MDKVEVEVLELELLEGVAESLEGSLVAVVSVPKLGSDENLGSGGVGLLEPLLQGTAASLLVGISGGGVNVTVAGVESGDDGVLSLLAVGSLVDTKSNLGDFVAVVEADGEARRVAGGGVSRVLASRHHLLHAELGLTGSELGGHCE